MGLFSAVGRWFKAIGYLFTGQVDSARKVLDSNPHVMNAKYDEMISSLSLRINQYVDAAAKVSAFSAQKKAALLVNAGEIEKLQKLQVGAMNMGKQVSASLQSKGIDPASDVEYIQHRSAHNDFSSTLLEKMKTKKELEDSIAESERNNKNNLATLKTLQREYQELKKEQGEMVGRMISANVERELNQMVAGLDANTGNVLNERNKIREMVMEAEAGAKITGQVAGTDARRAEEEYLSLAVSSAANSEFDAATGVASKAPASLPSNTDNIVIDAISTPSAQVVPVKQNR